MSSNDDSSSKPPGLSPPLAGSHVVVPEHPTIAAPVSGTDGGVSETEGSDVDSMETEDRDIENTTGDLTPTRKGKRKRRKRSADQDLELSPVLSEGMDLFLAEVDKLCNETGLLSALMAKHLNTKNEIKEKTRFMEKIANKVKQFKNNLKFRAPIGSFDFKGPLQVPNIPRSVISVLDSVSPGPTFCERCKTEIGIEEKNFKEIKDEIAVTKESSDLDDGKFAALIRRDWPDKLFISTELKRGRVTLEPPENTKIILLSDGEVDKLKQGDGPNWIEKLTGQNKLLEKISSRKYVPFMCEKLSTLMALGEDADEPEKCKILVMVTDNSTEGIVGQFKAFQSFEKKLTKHCTVNIAPIGDINVGFVRKVAECSFRDPGYKLVLNTMSSKVATDTIIVKSTQDGRSFADLVKGVKDGVDTNNIDVTVRNIKRTKDGSVLIVTTGNTDRLRKEIEDNVGGIRTQVGGRKSIEILDLDPTVTKTEVIDEIKKVASSHEQEDTTVDGLRTTNSGFQIAYLTVPRSLGERLIQVGALRIGWTSCRVKEKINIDRCINCLQVGHHSSKCKEPKTTVVKCLRCTESGHIAKDCVNERYCVKCGIKGHRNDTFACPHYRELVLGKKQSH